MQPTSLTVQSSPSRNRTSDATIETLKSHLGLVRYVAAKFGFIHSTELVLQEDDLVQVGMVGLLDAIEKYDPGKGVRFQTYAVTRIRGAILDELRKTDWIPRSVRKRSRTARKVAQDVQDREYRSMSAEDIANKLCMTLEEYQELMREAKGATMDYRVSFDEDIELVEHEVSSLVADPFDIVSAEEIRSRLIDAVETLPQRERLIITLYYYEGLTFKEIGAVLRISESRVFQIHTSVIKSLRTLLKDLV
jgi:RNA polymerase sigma factor for flagellar operon FliA